ncbi:MAG TPA: matrixin family metalloprotease [Longimicrobiales bacterium]|nr:matrixin family metalloprotease [Longimicrobiales bacterium]
MLLLAPLALGCFEAAGSDAGADGGRAFSDLRIPAWEACGEVGYLCAQLLDSLSFRVLRWPDRVQELSIRVPLPEVAEGIGPERARRMQESAVRGIRVWDGLPLRLRVNDETETSPDIVVEWVRRLPGTQVGMTRIRWIQVFGRSSFSIPSIQIATHNPGRRALPQSPGEVQVVAVHEMGHALGLPHSDQPGDVMFSSNAARPLSIRDRRTVRALYGLPVGATVFRNEPPQGP